MGPTTDTQTQSHTDTHTQSQTDTHTQSHTDTHTQSHTDTQTQSHTDTHTQSQTDTHTQSHTDTHTQSHTVEDPVDVDGVEAENTVQNLKECTMYTCWVQYPHMEQGYVESDRVTENTWVTGISITAPTHIESLA